MSEENVIVAVFEKVTDKEKDLFNTANFQSDESDKYFDVKYLKYEVNYSVKYGISYLLFLICVIVNCWK